MQWTDEPNAGFSRAETTFLPVISEGAWSHRRVNVESQRRDPQSLLNWMSRMIRVRKECPEIGWGHWQLLSVESPHVLAIRYDWRSNALIVVHNFADSPCEVELNVEGPGHDRLSDLLDDADSQADDGKHQIALAAHGYHWFRVGGMNYALDRDRQ